MTIGKIVQDRVRKAEAGNAVAQNTADLVAAVKNRDGVAVSGKNDRDRETGGTCTDDRYAASVRFLRPCDHLVRVGRGDIILDDREMHRTALDPPYTVAFTLLLVVADERADRGEGIVLKEHPAGFVEFAVFQKADDFRNICVNRTSLLAAGNLAAETMICFFHNMQCHMRNPPIVN